MPGVSPVCPVPPGCGAGTGSLPRGEAGFAQLCAFVLKQEVKVPRYMHLPLYLLGPACCQCFVAARRSSLVVVGFFFGLALGLGEEL